ncbi:MAG: hypothetical protein NTZ60_07345 [Campylobacterales bacterium]|nr:hypothetical protein [Campylobacterales bacterium]
MESAKDFFNNPGLSSTKCHYLTENHDQSLEWEKESVSLHSCGTVKDNEVLARNIFSPHHYDPKTGNLTTLAFDDILNKGLSVLRFDYTTHDSVITIGQLKKKDTHEYHGYITIQASCIRGYIVDSKRAMAIYDTAMIKLPAHADICNISVTTKSSKNLLRIFLREAFSKLVPIP